jgi:hypothetical protein
MLNTRENFKTDTQYKRWLDYYEYFSLIKDIQKTHQVFYYSDYDNSWHILGQIAFTKTNNGYMDEWEILEITSKNSTCCWVGSMWNQDKHGHYRYMHIDEPLTKFIKKYKLKYFENEVYIKG